MMLTVMGNTTLHKMQHYISMPRVVEGYYNSYSLQGAMHIHCSRKAIAGNHAKQQSRDEYIFGIFSIKYLQNGNLYTKGHLTKAHPWPFDYKTEGPF